MIRLTSEAALQIKLLLAKEDEGESKGFRLYVEKGGCSGMQYGMVFDEPRENDHHYDLQGVKVLVDPFSAQYVQGALVDFSDSLNDEGFKITNPNAAHSCGCGRSFDT